MKKEATDGDFINLQMRHRNSLPANLSVTGSNELRELAYSAQQALSQVLPDDSMPIDPALQSYDHEGDTVALDDSPRALHQDTIMSSIEDGPGDQMEGVETAAYQSSHLDSMHSVPNGNKEVHHPQLSSEASGTAMIAPPITPNRSRFVKVSSSGQRTSQSSRTRKNHTPGSPLGGHRRDTGELDQEIRAISSATGDGEEDMASLALALKLQMEEHGLRRRSK